MIYLYLEQIRDKKRGKNEAKGEKKNEKERMEAGQVGLELETKEGGRKRSQSESVWRAYVQARDACCTCSAAAGGKRRAENSLA